MFLVLFVSLFLIKVATSCPDQCTCSNGKLTCKVPAARSIPHFLHVENTTILDLSGNNILNIPKGSLKIFPNLEELILDENKVYFVENGAFLGCPKLKKISLQTNNLRFLEDDLFTDLPMLEELYLAKNKLNSFPHIKTNRKLKKLCVSYNEIESLPMGALSENIHLSVLKLKRNKLETLPRDAFPKDVTSYTAINLVSNRLRDIPPVVTEMTQLQSLSLCYNPIKVFKSGTFGAFPKLTMLSMTKVGLTEISEGVFNFDSLEELYLGKNKVVDQSIANIQLKNLKVLVLSNNNIQVIHDQAFSGIPKLENLDLSHNHIYEIEENAFRDLENLRELNLHENRISVTPTLIHNFKLEKLNLDSNSITEVRQQDLRNTNLVELSISNNSMTSFNPLLLGNASGMKSLDLSYNKFASLPSVFSNSPINLENLNLSDNAISNITKEDFTTRCQSKTSSIRRISTIGQTSINFVVVTQDLPKLKTLNLKGNNISLLPFDVFSFISNLKYLHLCRNNLMDLGSHAFNKLPFLEVFTADKNYLEEVNDNTFTANLKLKRLSLSNNNINMIGKRAFKNLKELEELWLLHNELTKPPKLSVNSALRVLGLCFNPLGDIDDGALHGPEGLEVVLLRSTGLRRLSKYAFGSTHKIQKLNLASGNNLTSVPAAIKSMPLLQSLLLSGNPIEFVYMSDFANLNNLREIRMDSMRLQSFDITMLFPALPALRTLYLASNPWHCGCEMQSYALGIEGSRAQIETVDRNKMACASPPRYKGKRFDFLRLGDFRQCTSSSIKEITSTTVTLHLPYIAMLGHDHTTVFTRVSYQPLGGGMEKVEHVSRFKRQYKLLGLTPHTCYVICIKTMTLPEKHRYESKLTKLHSEENEACHKVKTSKMHPDTASPENHGPTTSISLSSRALTILYAVVGGVLGLVAISVIISLAVWCRRSDIERHNRFANISGQAEEFSNNHMRESKSKNGVKNDYGNRLESTASGKTSHQEGRPVNSDVNGSASQNNGCYVNNDFEVLEAKARTKL